MIREFLPDGGLPPVSLNIMRPQISKAVPEVGPLVGSLKLSSTEKGAYLEVFVFHIHQNGPVTVPAIVGHSPASVGVGAAGAVGPTINPPALAEGEPI